MIAKVVEVGCPHCKVVSTVEAWDKSTALEFIGSMSEVDMIASIGTQEHGTIHICPDCKVDHIVGEVVR